ncbi:hypothetical protein HDU91_001288 [Kappamyces sp. JEL0680]|nr:hypothetical protein HDU91_001288 [Kappamyces sp. JEL0680]
MDASTELQSLGSAIIEHGQLHHMICFHHKLVKQPFLGLESSRVSAKANAAQWSSHDEGRSKPDLQRTAVGKQTYVAAQPKVTVQAQRVETEATELQSSRPDPPRPTVEPRPCPGRVSGSAFAAVETIQQDFGEKVTHLKEQIEQLMKEFTSNDHIGLLEPIVHREEPLQEFHFRTSDTNQQWSETAQISPMRPNDGTVKDNEMKFEELHMSPDLKQATLDLHQTQDSPCRNVARSALVSKEVQTVADSLSLPAVPEPARLAPTTPEHNPKEGPDSREETSEIHPAISGSLSQIPNVGESILYQPPQVAVPVMKGSVSKGIHGVLRHLQFGKHTQRVNYFRLFANGLLCGQLVDVKLVQTGSVEETRLHCLHPMLKQAVLLDLNILIELVQNIEMPEMAVDKPAKLLETWLVGLQYLHIQLQSLSKSFTRLEERLKKDISVAQALVLCRDQIAMNKLASQGNVQLDQLDTNIIELHSVDFNRVNGSMMLFSNSFIDWVKILL